MRNKAHIFRKNDNLNMQNDFIFFDTETQVIDKKYDDDNNLLEEIQELKLGWALYWNRITKIKEWFYFEDKNSFWDFIESKNNQEIILYAHNTEFDFKICDGYRELIINRGYTIKKIYIENKIFILHLTKRIDDFEYTIKIYDTFNYVDSSLEKIGIALNLPKIKIDFNTCNKKELSDYCKNDVMITYYFMENLINFLEKYELTKLMPTGSGIAFNAFRHKFYDKEKNPIYIHDNNDIIKLERESYRGGITDCFNVGTMNGIYYKLDVNSMYPYIMKHKNLPVRLLVPIIENYSIEDLKNTLDIGYDVIAECTIRLPKDKAYILSHFEINNDTKCGFLYGEYKIVLCTPEIKYVLKYGEILKIERMAIYESKNIFKEYVDFFYGKRLEFESNNNMVYALFCKLCLNKNYGKWGQRDTNYEILHKEKNNTDIEKFRIIEDKREYNVLRIGENLIKLEKNDDNSYDSFVAISSMITAYARMYLIEIIEKAGRKNICYCDTDSVIITEDAIKNIKDYIDFEDKRILGKLKIEGKSNIVTIYRPKYYIFDNELKCKGVKTKGSNIAVTLDDNFNFWKVKQLHFEKFKTSIRKNHVSKQYLTMTEKTINKAYDKGEINNGIVTPYDAKDVILCKN